jgi:hypothetical protein
MTVATTTDTGVAERNIPEADGLDDAASAFLAAFTPKDGDEDASKKKPSTEKTSEKTEREHEAPEEDEEATDESPEADADEKEAEETDEQDGKPEKKYVDSDEVFVKVKVGDEELEVPVKDLKRLHGQEVALTRRSQEVAAQRKEVEQQSQRYAAGLDVLIKQASAKAAEYRNINFMALAKNPAVTEEQLTQLQDDARKAFEQEHFLKSELNTFVTAVTEQQKTELATRAKETVKTLGDQASPMYIEGWNQKVYRDTVAFAKQMGLDAELADNIVDAPAIKLIHMAMLYQKGASKVVVTKKTDKTPKKIVKTSNSPAARPAEKPAAVKKAMSKLQKTGSVDDAGEAFLARMQGDDKE